MNELQQQLATLCGMLDRAQQYGMPVVDIQRRISAVNDQIYTLRDLQRNLDAMIPQAKLLVTEGDGDILWA
jgi:hypothetical protein